MASLKQTTVLWSKQAAGCWAEKLVHPHISSPPTRPGLLRHIQVGPGGQLARDLAAMRLWSPSSLCPSASVLEVILGCGKGGLLSEEAFGRLLPLCPLLSLPPQGHASSEGWL